MEPERTSSLNVGDLAPDFHLPSSAGREIALGDYRGRAHVVLFFVRAYG
jgi:peroxiredoxin Q/BCP